MAPTKKVQSRGARRTQHTQWTQRTSLPQLDKRQSVVSKAAYLLGVPTFIFEKDHEPPDWEIYQELEECRTQLRAAVAVLKEPKKSPGGNICFKE